MLHRLLAILSLTLALPLRGQGQASVVADTSVWDVVTLETPAKFPGGHEALLTFIAYHLPVPDTTHGSRIILGSIVEADGSITEPHVKRGSTSLANAEALRLVTAMPRWVPGTIAGNPVRTRMQLPLQICLR